MSSTEAGSFSQAEQQRLLATARASIAYGLRQHGVPALAVNDVPERLLQPGASFVTLSLRGVLRGCIGSIVATRPLIEDVNCNAYAAAFNDPRFSAVSAQEIAELTLSLSILSTPRSMSYMNEEDLVAQLQPKIDGLVIAGGERRATFLPSVWDTLPRPVDFLSHLKRKAGLMPQDSITYAARYTVEYISD
jgi:hypothetical protein